MGAKSGCGLGYCAHSQNFRFYLQNSGWTYIVLILQNPLWTSYIITELNIRFTIKLIYHHLCCLQKRSPRFSFILCQGCNFLDLDTITGKNVTWSYNDPNSGFLDNFKNTWKLWHQKIINGITIIKLNPDLRWIFSFRVPTNVNVSIICINMSTNCS